MFDILQLQQSLVYQVIIDTLLQPCHTSGDTVHDIQLCTALESHINYVSANY